MRTIGLMAGMAIVGAATPALSKEVPQTARPVAPLDIGDWLGPDDYPPGAIFAGEQGRVVVIVSIDATGHPTACSTDVSIGAPALEKGTCDLVLSKGKFEPARDKEGRAIASRYMLPVRWKLPESGEGRQTTGPWSMTKLTSVDAADQIVRCDVVIDGKAVSATPEQCRGRGELKDLRKRLNVSGPFRMRQEFAALNGDTPPPVPPSGGEGRLLALYEVRQQVDAEGTPSDCTVVVSAGEWAEEEKKHLEKTPCESGHRFFPVVGKDGVAKAAQVLLMTRITLLPPVS